MNASRVRDKKENVGTYERDDVQAGCLICMLQTCKMDKNGWLYQLLPTYLLTYLPTYLLTYLPTYLPIYSSVQLFVGYDGRDATEDYLPYLWATKRAVPQPPTSTSSNLKLPSGSTSSKFKWTILGFFFEAPG